MPLRAFQPFLGMLPMCLISLVTYQDGMNVLLAFVEWIDKSLAKRSEEGIAGSGIQIRSMSGDLRIWTNDKKYHVTKQSYVLTNGMSWNQTEPCELCIDCTLAVYLLLFLSQQ